MHPLRLRRNFWYDLVSGLLEEYYLSSLDQEDKVDENADLLDMFKNMVAPQSGPPSPPPLKREENADAIPDDLTVDNYNSTSSFEFNSVVG